MEDNLIQSWGVDGIVDGKALPPPFHLFPLPHYTLGTYSYKSYLHSEASTYYTTPV